MKKYILLFVALQNITIIQLKACDFCNSFMGITPYDNQSGISLVHRYRSFSGYAKYNQSSTLFPETVFRTVQDGIAAPAPFHIDPSGKNSKYNYSVNDFEVFKATELRLKYFIHQRIEVNAVLPFIYNSALINEVKNRHSGLGDASFFAGYHLIKKLETTLQQRLTAGAGLKLPTGNNSKKNPQGERLNYELQTGTGAVDYFGYLQYTIGYKKAGVSINTFYKISGKNTYHEQLSNSSSSNASLFYRLAVKKVIVIPAAQFYYEFTKGLKVNEALENGTQMNVAMAGPAMDVFYKNFSVNLSMQLPMYEKVAENGLGNGCKFTLALTYSFNQSKYLIAPKPKA